MDKATMKAVLLLRGHAGESVIELKKALRQALGAAAKVYPGLTKGDAFDADTETALRAWQATVGLVADGIGGPRTLAALGLRPAAALAVSLDAALVGKLFPFTRTSNIARNLPYVSAALAAFALTEADLVAVALATIRAETEGFVPIAEQPSHFNTLPGQAAFSAYDGRLGNDQTGDGCRYRGRGFVQLTGRQNYQHYGKLLAIPLVDNPDQACAPEIAACLLAAFLDENRNKLLKALAKDDLKAARRVVNGGSHGLPRFVDTFRLAQQLWAAAPPTRVGAKAKAGAVAAGTPLPAGLNVVPDQADLRDRPYVPPLGSLPQVFPPDDEIKRSIGAYSQAGLILDQGQEGACTGFGLACVINYLRWRGAGRPRRLESVSPRMLYQFARRFDEYEGENYEGSSCRGALKGWYHNGVCLESKWPYSTGDNGLPTAGWEVDSIERTLGVYYRIDPKAITDLQAAILDIGAVFVSSWTHAGWSGIAPTNKAPESHAGLPVIAYDGTPSRNGGHAFALVGFNRTGFVIQNSWGKGWGAGGFAVVSYADWLAHAMDAWVAALGVPGVVGGRLADGSQTTTAAAAAAARANWWDEATAYRHSIVLGNNGRVDRYDSLDGVNRSLQNQACILPDAWFRAGKQQQKRLVIYAHGGINSEVAAIRRAQAMGRYFLGNGCYPLFLVWKSGLLESIGNILADKMSPRAAELAGRAGNWITDHVGDPIVEKTIGRPFARPLWSEMKENAELAVDSGRGGDQLSTALSGLAKAWGESFEVHLVAHSAGAILIGRLLANLAQKGLAASVKSVHLYAPACTVAFANRYYATQREIMDKLYLDLLSDQCERDDNVAFLYRKSLLYLVSNALEADLRMPVLGLEKVFDPQYADWDGSSTSAEALGNWRNAVELSRLGERLKIHAEQRIVTRRANGSGQPEQTAKASHAGFDNNVEVVGRTLERITGARLVLPVDDLVGF